MRVFKETWDVCAFCAFSFSFLGKKGRERVFRVIHPKHLHLLTVDVGLVCRRGLNPFSAFALT